MRFAFIADLHLSRYSQDKIEDVSNLPERLHSIKTVLSQIAEYCITNNIGTVIIGGDLLHNKSIIYAIAQKIMLDYFRNYPQLIFYIIDGNHDLSGKGADAISALISLDNEPNVKRIRKDHEMLDNILFVPYSYNMIKIIKESEADILISHFGLNEGILNSGISIIADISLKDLLEKYKLVLLGHYHKPQQIINDNISLYYVGSPVQLNWGEKGEEKRFLVVDTETLQVESIPTTGYKKYIEIELNSLNKDTALKAAQQAKADSHHVKVLMKEKVDVTDFKGDFNIVDKTETDITDRGITSSMSQEDRINRFVEIKEIPQIDIDEYIKEAFDIINNCEV